MSSLFRLASVCDCCGYLHDWCTDDPKLAAELAAEQRWELIGGHVLCNECGPAQVGDWCDQCNRGRGIWASQLARQVL